MSEKTRKIELRVSEEEWELIDRASRALFASRSQFVRSQVLPAARDLLRRTELVPLDSGEWETLSGRLGEEARSVPKLQSLLAEGRSGGDG